MKSIEQALKQEKPFANEKRKAMVNLIYTSNMVLERMEDFFAKYDLTHKQFNVLRIVKGAKISPSTAYIRERMLVKNCDASRIVDRLIQKDLLFKRKQKDDKRQVDIHLTIRGKEMLVEIAGEMKGIDSWCENLNLQDLKALNIILDKVRN